MSWLRQYFKQGTYEIVGFFEDDGQSGTDDSRKAFVEMLDILEKGKGNCIVVKTLSRAFRNYADQGYYLEEYFPSRNIRFISTMDPFIDSYAASDAVYSLDVPMYGVLNDRFAASTSKAVRRTFDDKRSKGLFIGAFPPWGFLKDPRDKNHLIPDPETAPIKIQMKDWLLYEGMSLAGVAKRLNELGIPNPTKYKQLKGWKYKNPHAGKNSSLWCGTTVRNVLLNPVNIGHMIQGKQKVISYKIHERVSVPKEDWFVAENTHEPIFTQRDYDMLYDLLQRNTRTSNKSEKVHLFAGFVRCAKCGRAMQRSRSGEFVYYKCRTHKDNSKLSCPVLSIREDRLIRAVFGSLRAQIELLENQHALIEKANATTVSSGYISCLAKQIVKNKEKLDELQKVYDGLYGDWKLGELSKEEYTRMREYYEKEMAQTAQTIFNMEGEQKRSLKEENGMPFKKFVKQGELTCLSRLALVTFVNMIYVHEKNEITVEFRFEDELHKAIKN